MLAVSLCLSVSTASSVWSIVLSWTALLHDLISRNASLTQQPPRLAKTLIIWRDLNLTTVSQSLQRLLSKHNPISAKTNTANADGEPALEQSSLLHPKTALEGRCNHLQKENPRPQKSQVMTQSVWSECKRLNYTSSCFLSQSTQPCLWLGAEGFFV